MFNRTGKKEIFLMSATVVTSLSKDAYIPQANLLQKARLLSESFKNNSITHLTEIK
jgi:hypothetical protein